MSGKRFFLLIIVFCLCRTVSAKETPQEKGLESINKITAEAHIGFFADDALKGREAGTNECYIAGNYIVSYLKSLGLKPAFDSYFQPFDAYSAERQKKKRFQVNPDSIAELKNVVHRKISLRNVLCKIEGKNPDEIVILGAHYDHLGIDETLDGDKIYNGADDNASGVAAVLQVARAFLVSGVRPERTVIFAFWDGEEKGLLGSKYFVQTFDEINKVKGYINLDMIGRNNDESNPKTVVYFYTESHPAFGDWLKNDIQKYGLNLEPNYRPWDNPVGGSDNSSFAERKIPIIWYHTNGHPDYHQPSDHTDKINWDKTVDITKAVFLNLWNMANEKSF